MNKALLFLMSWMVVPEPAFAAESLAFEVRREKDTIAKFTFSESQFKVLERKAPKEIKTEVTGIMKGRGVDCCAPQKRISDSVWQCCDGRTVIISSDKRVQSVLQTAFTPNRSDTPK